MKKTFSKKIIQEALSQELSKSLINEKMTDIPGNMIAGVKNAVSSGLGSYNVGKINNQIKKSAERIGKEWDSVEAVARKGAEKIKNSSNPQVAGNAQNVERNVSSIGKAIKQATAQMNALANTGITSVPGAQSNARSGIEQDPNGQLMNGLDDNEDDFKTIEKTTKFGNKYKESAIQRWAEKLGMDTDKIGVHEWSALNKTFLELRSLGANPFSMTPEQVDKLVRYERARNSAIEKGQADEYLGNFQHYDYVFGKAKADKLRQALADKHGVPVEKLRNAYLGDPPGEKKTEPAKAEPPEDGMSLSGGEEEDSDPEVPNVAVPSVKKSDIDPETGQDIGSMKVGMPSQRQGQVARGPKVQMPPTAKPQAQPSIDPETGQDVNSMKVGPRVDRNAPPRQPSLQTPPAPPIPLTNVKPVAPQPEQAPIPLTKVKPVNNVALPPSAKQDAPKAFAPPMNNFFGELPAQDTGKEVQVGSFDNPGFGEKPATPEDQKSRLASDFSNAKTPEAKEKARKAYEDFISKSPTSPSAPKSKLSDMFDDNKEDLADEFKNAKTPEAKEKARKKYEDFISKAPQGPTKRNKLSDIFDDEESDKARSAAAVANTFSKKIPSGTGKVSGFSKPKSNRVSDEESKFERDLSAKQSEKLKADAQAQMKKLLDQEKNKDTIEPPKVSGFFDDGEENKTKVGKK